MRYLLIAALLLTAAPAAAQDLKWPTAVFTAGATADWVSTHRNMKYFREVNPLIRWLDHKPSAMVAVGAAMDAGAYVAWYKLTNNHRKWRVIGLYSAAAFRFYVAARNIRIYQKHKPHSARF